MKIIFVNRFFFPDHSATSQILSDLAFALAEQNLEVQIITSRLRYDDPSACLKAHEHVKKVAVHRVYTSRFGRANLVGRSLDYLTFYVFAFAKLFSLTRRGDIVVVKTDPPLFSVVALPVVRLRRAKLVNWLQDVFPEIATAFGIGRKGIAARLMSLAKRLRNASLRGAQTNIVLGELMAERLRKEQIADEQITIIPNWSDGSVIKPFDHQHNPMRTQWQLGDLFVVGYSGNLGRTHDFSALMDAAMVLNGFISPTTNRKILFLLVGDGAQRQRLEEIAKQRALTNIRFEPYQPREKLAQSLSAMDVHIISLKPEFEGLIVPSKFYGVAAAGRPTLFIGDREGEIPHLLKTENCGLTVSIGQGDELATQIRRLADDPLLCQTMGRNARTIFEQHYDTVIAVKKWLELIANIKS